MTPDYLDMLHALSDTGVDFLLVGAHARAVHGTGDLDIWIRREVSNAQKVFKALAEFGAPVVDLSIADFLEPDMVF